MHIGLTDHLLCPRCQEEEALILLIQETTEEGRVLRGWLGCPRCRTDYPVEGGVADLRSDRASAPPAPETVQGDDLPLRIAALVGLTEGPGFAYLAPALAPWVSRVAGLVPGIEWVAAGRAVVREPEMPGVSRIVFDGPRLPFASGRLRGAVLVRPEAADLREAARTIWPGSRLVAFEAAGRDDAAFTDAGLVIAARDEATVVAVKRIG